MKPFWIASGIALYLMFLIFFCLAGYNAGFFMSNEEVKMWRVRIPALEKDIHNLQNRINNLQERAERYEQMLHL